MALEQPFTTQPPTIATYNVQDLITGQLALRLLAATTSLAAGSEEILVTNVQYSDDEYTERNASGTTTLVFRSSPLAFSRFIAGTAVFSAAIYTANGNGSFAVKLQEWNGSSATDLSAEITSSVVTTGVKQQNILLKMPVTSEKNIIAGNQIQLTVKCITTSANLTRWSHDPAGRQTGFTSSEEVSTVMSVDVPVRIDL